MSEMRGPLEGEFAPNKPRNGCWFWGLVIAGAVVGLMMILGVLMIIPAFMFKFNGPPPKQAEAKTNLGAIFTTQVAYYGENSTYAGGKNCFENMGWSPEGETRYNYYCGDEVIFCNRPGCDRCLNTKLPGGKANKRGGVLGPTGHSEAESLDGARNTQDDFTVYAVGNIDGDTHCDVWSMRDNKELRNDYNDVGD